MYLRVLTTLAVTACTCPVHCILAWRLVHVASNDSSRPSLQMDIDSTGDIDATEVARALTLIEAEDGAPIITEAQAQALLDEFDLTHSGKLNLEEFEAMMMSERQPASSDEKDSEDKV